MNQDASAVDLLSSIAAHLAAAPRTADLETQMDAGALMVTAPAIDSNRGRVYVVATDLTLADFLEHRGEAIQRRVAGLLLVGPGSASVAERVPRSALVACLEADTSGEPLIRAVEGLLERVELHRTREAQQQSIRRYRYELGELVEIARALSQERDIANLLPLILERSRFITGADAGSIYVLEPRPQHSERPSPEGVQPRAAALRFKTSQNESVAFESAEFTVPLTMRSIAGAAALTSHPINIPDVRFIDEDTPYGFDPSFDEKVGYRTRSMLTVPMISAEDEVIGVIQLINKKLSPELKLGTEADFDERVVPFDSRCEELLQTFASQAGIALENALLYDEIQRIFEGFVRASVQAIEQRDPTTSGHSLRVSVLSCRLAEVVDGIQGGVHRDASFSRRELKELEYAALLHDFGKIGVREQVLVKAKKLYPHELAAIRSRFQYLLKVAEVEMLQTRLEMMARGASEGDLLKAELDYEKQRGHLSGALQLVLQANEPTVLNEGDFSAISRLAEETYRDALGKQQPLLTAEEVGSLQVTKGSLTHAELGEIRSHVSHTYNFLARIPWGKTMARIPVIAGAHHERLDGSGYPGGMSTSDIPLQSKIMTIADIYDALTARDRPYKRALSRERALAILGFEVKDGHIDGELVRLFTEAKVFEVADQPLEY